MADENYSGSSKTRPDKNLSGGFGNYCCVPGCTSAVYKTNRQKNGITLFLPTTDAQRKQWLKVLTNFRRKGGADSLDVKKRLYVCEFHFKTDEIRITLGIGRKKLKPGVVPSIFEFKKTLEGKKRKSPKERVLPNASVEDSSELSELSEEETFECVNPNNVLPLELGELEILHEENSRLRENIYQLEVDVCSLQEENEELKSKHIYTFKNISRNEKHFTSATGLDPDSFKQLLEYLDPGEDCKNFKMYDTAKRLSEEKFTETVNEDETF